MLDNVVAPYFVREPSPDSGSALLRHARSQLGDLIIHLEMVRSAVTVSVAALRHQNCELDEDVASVLQRSVGDRLHNEIERASKLVAALGSGPK